MQEQRRFPNLPNILTMVLEGCYVTQCAATSYESLRSDSGFDGNSEFVSLRGYDSFRVDKFLRFLQSISAFESK